MTDVAGKIDATIAELLLAVQNVGVVRDFSNTHLNEVRIAAIYLSAAIMDTLTSLINWVNASSGPPFAFVLMKLVLAKTFMTPDFDKKLASVHARSGLYTSTIQFKVIREKRHEDVLDWVFPSDTRYITPKGEEEVGDTCHIFLDSPEYRDWVREGPSTLICSAKGASGGRTSLTFSRCWEITSCVLCP
jgi:hypothetical protein